MKSAIVEHLEPGFEPVALIWSDQMPDEARQFKEGRFGCILHLLAEASRRGCVAGGSRETIACPGGRAALGFGTVPMPLFELMERAAADSILQLPGWRKLHSEGPSSNSTKRIGD